MGTKHSPEWGANAERTAILAKVRRMPIYMVNLRQCISKGALIEFLLERNERYNKRKGGLDRR